MAGCHGTTRLKEGFRLLGAPRRWSRSASKIQRIHGRSLDKCREVVADRPGEHLVNEEDRGHPCVLSSGVLSRPP